MSFVLGVDGGNTKADYALCSVSGEFIDGLRSGTCSHESFNNDFDKAREVMGACIKELLSRNGLKVSDISSAAFGLAGADFPFQIAELSKRIKSLGFGRFEVANDSFLGIKAACRHGYGVCSINGTGTVAGVVDIKGHFMQIGGVGGQFFGNDGGGSYIAGRGMRLADDYFFRCGEYTALAGKLMKLLKLDDDAAGRALLAERYIMRDRDKIKSHDIINLMYDMAAGGDKACLDELNRIGEQLALSAGGCISVSDFSGCDEIDIVMAGSVWAKSKAEYIHNAFRRKLISLTDKKLNFIKLISPPVVGAVLWALEIEAGAFPNEARQADVTAAVSGCAAFHKSM